MGQQVMKKGRASSMGGGLAVGASVSMALTLAIGALLAALVDREILPWERIGYGILGLLFVSSAAGAQTAVSRVKRQRLAVTMLAGLIYWVCLLGVTALFFGGQYEAVGVTGLVILAGCGCVLLLGGRQKRGGKPRKRGNRHR